MHTVNTCDTLTPLDMMIVKQSLMFEREWKEANLYNPTPIIFYLTGFLQLCKQKLIHFQSQF